MMPPRHHAASAPAASPETPEPSGIIWGSAAAGALIAYGLRRRGVTGFAIGITGAAFLATLIAPRLAPTSRGGTRTTRPLEFEGSFIVGRSAREVFAFFRNFEHFTLLGDLLHDIEDFDDGRSRWRIAAPDGALVEWDVIAPASTGR